jgi:hypothetical protein
VTSLINEVRPDFHCYRMARIIHASCVRPARRGKRRESASPLGFPARFRCARRCLESDVPRPKPNPIRRLLRIADNVVGPAITTRYFCCISSKNCGCRSASRTALPSPGTSSRRPSSPADSRTCRRCPSPHPAGAQQRVRCRRHGVGIPCLCCTLQSRIVLGREVRVDWRSHAAIALVP